MNSCERTRHQVSRVNSGLEEHLRDSGLRWAPQKVRQPLEWKCLELGNGDDRSNVEMERVGAKEIKS